MEDDFFRATVTLGLSSQVASYSKNMLYALTHYCLKPLFRHIYYIEIQPTIGSYRLPTQRRSAHRNFFHSPFFLTDIRH